MKKLLIPKKLKEGAHVAVVAPSSRDDGSRIVQAKKFFEDNGYRVTLHPQLKEQFHCFAGTDDVRASALNEVFADKSVDAIICARGGNGAVHILDKLDYNAIKSNPKIFMGYSDATALHSAIHNKAGLLTFHGPDFAEFGQDGYDEYSLLSSLNLLSGKRQESIFEGVQSNDNFKVSGKVIAGNLSLFNALLGTEWEQDFSNSILMIEDIGEETSHLDRILWQWRAAGKLDKIKALIVGRFSNMKDSGYFSFELTVNDIVKRHMKGLDVPVVSGVSFGHKGRNPAIPYGIKATAEVQDSTLKLIFDSQVVE